ncbi:FAD binding domain-containing protein [Pseudoclavibacter sp. RFBA6]|uniref:FAD binding domain-containing protein n=1 Tax=Pseudoclavibacter sp. RFBA6 TaxID=2080573 RepID=UPI000CE7E001|nr:FAD binding domain-containing protein [Pseudoclavibacter sp. RFBA6]PPG37441.1 FAD-binding molybdopterin dehydrogenase [Pseudoclavibacter sp. RFBA6]
MDITTVRSYRVARSREDLLLAPGEVILAGGTWLMSEPQPATTGFVDVTGMAWPDIEADTGGLRVAATCSIATLVAWAKSAARGGTHPSQVDWPALSLVPAAADALLASFKIWNTATVGGNVCRAFAAAGMVSLCVALDGTAEIWRGADDIRLPVAELVTGDGTTVLRPGDVLRSIHLPAAALRSHARLLKIALAEHGRSGAVVTGRVDPAGGSVFTVTAATQTPTVLAFPQLPTAAELAERVGEAQGYYSDPLGSADWRRGVSIVLAERIRKGLS